MRPRGPVGAAPTVELAGVGVRVEVVMTGSLPGRPGGLATGTSVVVTRSARPGHMAGFGPDTDPSPEPTRSRSFGRGEPGDVGTESGTWRAKESHGRQEHHRDRRMDTTHRWAPRAGRAPAHGRRPPAGSCSQRHRPVQPARPPRPWAALVRFARAAATTGLTPDAGGAGRRRPCPAGASDQPQLPRVSVR